MKQARRTGLFSFLMLALALSGCAASVDGEGTGSSPANLGGEACETQSSALTSSAASKEVSTDVDEYQLAIDNTQTEIGGSTCRRVCACCARNGNRFCCSHCRFCSGPIGATDVLSP